jgi:hypothetical protein
MFSFVFTMRAAPHPFSIRSLLERQALAACGHPMEKRRCYFSDGLKGQNADAVIEERCHRNHCKKIVMLPAGRKTGCIVPVLPRAYAATQPTF